MTTTIQEKLAQREADITQTQQEIAAIDQRRGQLIASLNGLIGARNQLKDLLTQPEQTNELPDPQLPTGRKRGSRA